MQIRSLVGIGSLVAFAQAAGAATPSFGLEPEGVMDAVREWRATRGAQWRAETDAVSDSVEFLYGGRAPALFRPRAGSDADWITLARHWTAETAALHGLDPAQIAGGRVVHLPLGMANGTDKVTVGFTQEIAGVPVEGANLNLLFDTAGGLLSVQSTGVPRLAPSSATPAVTQRAALRAARAAFRDLTQRAPTAESAPELVFARQADVATLAWHTELTYIVPDEVPSGWRFTVDAATGRVIGRRTTIHYADVTGHVDTLASPGTLPDIASNPEQPLPAGYLRVDSALGTVYTDRNGDFTIPGTDGPIDVTLRYQGPFNVVYNQAGPNYSVTFPGLTSAGANNLLMNPSAGQFNTGEANGFLHVGVVRDYIRDTIPSDSTADFVATSNVNISSSCNAFFSGGSVNYYRASGSCVNTAYSTVVAHEYGHWLNSRYGTGNGSDGMGEGNADVFAMYAYDTPIVGEHFFNSGGNIRSGNNGRQYCGDGNGGCYGQVHADGEVWMGAAWKTRVQLKNSLGSALGQATADGLFMGWMNAFDQSAIDSVIELQWLVLDDDDGDINNGTPNHAAIDAGFTAQGFPGFDLAGIEYSLTPVADTADEFGPYTVAVDVTSSMGATIAAVDLHYFVVDGPLQTMPMVPVGGDTWQAALAGRISPSFIRYFFSASDAAGRSSSFPALAPEELFEFNIGVLESFLSNDFEGGPDDGWSVGSAEDDALEGQWLRGDPVGTIAQPEDDHSPSGVTCWFTGQGTPGGDPNADDVDSGLTSLVSPLVDLRRFANARVSYWRWYSNSQGSAPAQDSLRVQLTVDGGQSWATAEQVGPWGTGGSPGWKRHEVAIGSTSSPVTRLRFQARDLGADSLIEAALDDVEGVGVRSSCDAPQSYCQTSPNSVGPGAVLSTFGTQSITANDLIITAAGLPAFQFGIFYYSQNQAQVPIGNGFLCAGAPFWRLPVAQSDDLGIIALELDVTSPPHTSAQITPGSTWNFALWYRDPAGGGAGFNFSDAKSIQFCR